MIIQNYVADISNHSQYFVAVAPQGDQNTRVLDITVLNNGIPIELDQNYAYSCSGHNGAGGLVQIVCEIVNNKIRIKLPASVIGFAGVGTYKVSMTPPNSGNSDEQTSSFTFKISIEADPMYGSDPLPYDDYITVQDLMERAKDINKWLIGEGTPSNNIGNILDLYLDTTTQKVYEKGNSGWTYKCVLGSTAYFAYASSASGADFSITYNSAIHTYMGLYAGQAQVQPTDPSLYQWVMIAGGDNMRVSDYGGSDNRTVIQADNIKGEIIINDVYIPANTTTSTTSVTVTNQYIAPSSVLEGVYTTFRGLNPIGVSMGNGMMTLVFPAMATSATAMIKIWNVGNYIYPAPRNWNDFMDLEVETENIDFSNFDNSPSSV